jgi:DNA helicase-2/ATP-dependent DNA helicase PcrA
MDIFQEKYEKLNKEQSVAVDTIDGPVMVVAGPGTGKTEVLALRIGNILKKTDTTPDGILCLTFTKSGVKAMKNRLRNYIGNEGDKVSVFTFHSFASKLLEKYHHLLGFENTPTVMSDNESFFLMDDVFESDSFENVSARTNKAVFFNNLNRLISMMKRYRITPEEFLHYIEADIEELKNSPDSIASRGENKGKIKKEVINKIESLERTKEALEFYTLYEEEKRNNNFIDYDDLLEHAVSLVEDFEDVRADIYENYLYILVDEHQDSSGVQNSFLKAVWKDTEMPNIFVVGDDRQLIYGFSGASLDYFEEFSHIFGKAKLITLVENYRSTENILSIADDLLQSSITKEKLKSNSKTKHKIILNEFQYPRDEIIGAGLYFQEKIKEGFEPEDCVLLLPKNAQVKEAADILKSMDLPVAMSESSSLFDLEEFYILSRALKIVSNPFNDVTLAASLLDRYSGINAFDAHKFLHDFKKKNKGQIEIEKLIETSKNEGLFASENNISKWGNQLKNWISELSNEKISFIISRIGNELLVDKAKDHAELLNNVEILRTVLGIASNFENKNKTKKLVDFIVYMERLLEYGIKINVENFSSNQGVQVMTLHKSKGLEYPVVWIGHMNEEVLFSQAGGGFSLPEKIKSIQNKKDAETVKRELYVALTRAKELCIISHADQKAKGGELNLLSVIKDLKYEHFIKHSKEDNEKKILSFGPETFIPDYKKEKSMKIEDVISFVQENFKEIRISVSMLNNFFDCPWKWYFRNFLKLPDVKSNSLALGSVVHAVIEFILKNKTIPKEEEIKEKIEDSLFAQGVDKEKDFLELKTKALEIINRWINDFYHKLQKDYSSERSLSFKDNLFPELLFFGKIDLIEKYPNGEVSVTDFKTGKPKDIKTIEKNTKDGRLSAYFRQLAMYSYLINGVDKKEKVTKSILLFLEAEEGDKDAIYSTYITEEHIDLLKKDIADYMNSLQNGDWIERECNEKYPSEKNVNRLSPKEGCEYCQKAKMFTL